MKSSNHSILSICTVILSMYLLTGCQYVDNSGATTNLVLTPDSLVVVDTIPDTIKRQNDNDIKKSPKTKTKNAIPQKKANKTK